MLTAGSVCARRLHSVGKHAGVGFTGFVSDARQLVNRAREEASNYKSTYGSHIPPSVLADRMAAYVHYFTLHGALRPFGANVIIGGYDPDLKKHELYMVEPSGVSYQYYGCAAGKGKQACKTEMEKLPLNYTNGNSDGITVNEAVKHLAKMVLMLYEDKEESKKEKLELEFSWICEESKFEHVSVPAEVVAEAKTLAEEEIAAAAEEEDDSEDDDEEMEG